MLELVDYLILFEKCLNYERALDINYIDLNDKMKQLYLLKPQKSGQKRLK
jgi:hypothetical protein